jgi:hypothetical protein
MDEYKTPCPYCGEPCECDLVDVGVGYVQCGPYHCEACGASEAGSSDEDLARMDPKTKWFAPGEPPSSLANMIDGRLATAAETKAVYRDRFAGSPDYDKPGFVEDWFKQHREPPSAEKEKD